jgi:hypothetical protein
MEWLKGFFIPLIEIVFIGGIVLFLIYIIGRAVWNIWSKSVKFFLRYKILRRSYPETTVKWIMDCIDKEIGYYEAEVSLMVKMYPDDQVNETLWIYDQIINELNKQGGNKNNGKFKRCNSQIKGTAELPTI